MIILIKNFYAMTHLKNGLLIIVMIFSYLAITGYTADNNSAGDIRIEHSFGDKLNSTDMSLYVPCESYAETNSISRECTIRIKTDDMDLEITLHDVGRWDCFKLKVRGLWSRITGRL